MSRIELLCLAVILALVALVALPLADMASGESRMVPVTVIEKAYAPPRSGVGIGAAQGSNGAHPVVVTTHEAEEYTLIVRDGDGKVFSREVKPEVYASAVEGQPMSLRFRFGGITGRRY